MIELQTNHLLADIQQLYFVKCFFFLWLSDHAHNISCHHGGQPRALERCSAAP